MRSHLTYARRGDREDKRDGDAGHAARVGGVCRRDRLPAHALCRCQFWRQAVETAQPGQGSATCIRTQPRHLLHVLDLFRWRRACLAEGLEFAAIYIGPILIFTLGLPLLRRIITLAKSEKIVSPADFVAARYGKNPTVAAFVALISLIGRYPLHRAATEGDLEFCLPHGRYKRLCRNRWCFFLCLAARFSSPHFSPSLPSSSARAIPTRRSIRTG